MREFRLDVLVLRERAGEKEVWVAQCLQYDIVAQATTLDQLRKTFVRLLVGNIVLALKRGVEPLSNFKPAPRRYWDQYDSGEKLGRNFPVSIPGDRIPKDLLDRSRIPRAQASMRLAQSV